MVVENSTEEISKLLIRIEHFCAYQERCVIEVEEKLKSWKVEPSGISKIIEKLQSDHFIDEERFARSFVRGKFHINKWGRNKINYELRTRRLPEKMLLRALSEISEADYENMIRHLVMKKKHELEHSKTVDTREKILNFVVGKGFEFPLVEKILTELKIENDRT